MGKLIIMIFERGFFFFNLTLGRGFCDWKWSSMEGKLQKMIFSRIKWEACISIFPTYADFSATCLIFDEHLKNICNR